MLTYADVCIEWTLRVGRHITSFSFFFVACVFVCVSVRASILRVFCVCFCAIRIRTLTSAIAFFALLSYTHTFAGFRSIHILSRSIHILSLDTYSLALFALFTYLRFLRVYTHTFSLSLSLFKIYVHIHVRSLHCLLHTFAHFAFTYVPFLRSLCTCSLSWVCWVRWWVQCRVSKRTTALRIMLTKAYTSLCLCNRIASRMYTDVS